MGASGVTGSLGISTGGSSGEVEGMVGVTTTAGLVGASLVTSVSFTTGEMSMGDGGGTVTLREGLVGGEMSEALGLGNMGGLGLWGQNFGCQHSGVPSPPPPLPPEALPPSATSASEDDWHR